MLSILKRTLPFALRKRPNICQVITPTLQSGSCLMSSQSSDEKIYELRVYKVWPKDFRPFLDLTTDWIHLRLNHSKLIGYWVSEIGGLNDVVHIWEYDNLNQRAGVRQALAQDPNWLKNYFSIMLQYVYRQENMLLKLTTENKLSQPDLKGVYELEEFSDNCSGTINSTGDSKLLGGFKTVIGPTSSGYRLWFHKSPDAMLENKATSKAVHNRLLLPTAWSPLQ